VIGFGVLAYDVAHLLGGVMLLVSFAMLAQRRLSAVVGALAVQGTLLGAAAIWQGYVQSAPQLYVTGVIALAAKAVAIPIVLRRLVAGLPPALRGEAIVRPGALMTGGAAMVALALLVVVPATTGVGALARVDLAAALAILLIGALMMVARQGALAQVAGLMTLENGLILAAVGVAGMPLVVEISTAGLVLVVAVIAGVFARQLREGFGSLDTAGLHRHRGEGR
jgi:hydrogenase-4 component E